MRGIRLSKSIMLLLALIAVLGCKVQADQFINESETLSLLVYERGRVIRQVHIRPGTPAHEEIRNFVRRDADGWSPTAVTYAPAILINGKTFSINFGQGSAVLNCPKGQFIKTVPEIEYQFLRDARATEQTPIAGWR